MLIDSLTKKCVKVGETGAGCHTGLIIKNI